MFNEINSILETAKEKISKLKDVAIEIILHKRVKMTEQKWAVGDPGTTLFGIICM